MSPLSVSTQGLLDQGSLPTLAIASHGFLTTGGITPVTTAGPHRSGGTGYRAKTISRELRDKERAARKAARKVRTRVVAALQDEPWFAGNEKAALAYLKTGIESEIVPQFIEDGYGRALMDAAIVYLIRQAALQFEQDEDFLLLASN